MPRKVRNIDTSLFMTLTGAETKACLGNLRLLFWKRAEKKVFQSRDKFLKWSDYGNFRTARIQARVCRDGGPPLRAVGLVESS